MQAVLCAGSDAWGIWHAAHPAQIPWTRYLDEVAEAGYRYLEPGVLGYLPTSAAVARQTLADRGLAIPGGTLFADIAGGRDQDLLVALDNTAVWLAEVGARYLVVLDHFWRDPETGAATRAARLSDGEWPAFADQLQRMAARARDAHGLRLVFHPHCDATVETEADIERLLVMTLPGEVDLCLDTGHHLYSGGDPVTFYARNSARTPYLHFKSMNADMLETVRREGLPWAVAVARGVTDEPERGAVDFAALAAEISAAGFSGFAVVEQDMFPCDPAVPLPLAKRTIAYLRTLGFQT